MGQDYWLRIDDAFIWRNNSDLGTKRQWQNAIAQNPNAENARVNPKTPTPKHKKSVAFHTLAICPWHYKMLL